VEKTQKLFPNLTIMVRAANRQDAYDYIDAGIRDIYRESLDTAVRLGIDVLVKLGYRKYTATRAGQNFIRYDEAAMHKLALHRHDESAYISKSREEIRMQQQLLASDREINPTVNDHAWDSDVFVDRFKDDARKEENKKDPSRKP